MGCGSRRMGRPTRGDQRRVARRGEATEGVVLSHGPWAAPLAWTKNVHHGHNEGKASFVGHTQAVPQIRAVPSSPCVHLISTGGSCGQRRGAGRGATDGGRTGNEGAADRGGSCSGQFAKRSRPIIGSASQQMARAPRTGAWERRQTGSDRKKARRQARSLTGHAACAAADAALHALLGVEFPGQGDRLKERRNSLSQVV